jgi:hypothetical protein
VIPFFGTLGFPGQGGVKKVEVSAFIFTFREEESFVYLMGRGRGSTKRLHVPSVLFDPLTDSVPDPVGHRFLPTVSRFSFGVNSRHRDLEGFLPW